MTAAIGEVVNIGTDEEISIEGLARVVKERTGSDSPITYIPTIRRTNPGSKTCRAASRRLKNSKALPVSARRRRWWKL